MAKVTSSQKSENPSKDSSVKDEEPDSGDDTDTVVPKFPKVKWTAEAINAVVQDGWS